MASTEFAKPQPVPDTELYTRGKAGETENRGESMVQKHLERMQVEKEDASLAKLAALMPQMGAMARALALKEANWDVEEALGMLRQFQVANLEKLNALTKKRKRLQEQAEEEAASSESASEEAPSSSSTSSSSDESADERARKSKRKSSGGSKKKRRSSEKKRSKRSKSEKERRRSQKRSSKDKDKDKDRNRASKRARREAESDSDRGHDDGDDGAAGKKLSHSRDYGRYGVLREGDAASKRDEFVLWAQDVKKVDIEQLAKWEEKELLAEYMEDFNTGTLPHRKYYDLQAYARQQALKAHKKAQAAGGPPIKSVHDDEEEVRRMRATERAAAGKELMTAAYERLKTSNLASEMRQQEMLRAQMALAYKTGDVEQAQKIMRRLEPEDPAKKR